MSHHQSYHMSTFTGESKEGFGLLGFLSHLLISLGVLITIISLAGYFFTDEEIFGLLILGGGSGVVGGIGLAFLNFFFS